MRTALLTVTLVFFGTTAPAETIGNVWAVGDDITRGFGTYPDEYVPGGYRDPLYRKLTAAGYTFQFVGTLETNPSPLLTAAGQQYHDGWSQQAILGLDWTYDFLLREIPTPDKVLLLLGTGDFNMWHNAQDQAEAIDRFDVLLTHLQTALPNAKFYVANLPPRTDGSYDTTIQTLFNPFVPEVAARHGAEFVDLHSAVPPSEMTYDGLLHRSTEEGYEKIADAWFNAIHQVPEPSAAAMLAGSLLVALVCLRKSRAD